MKLDDLHAAWAADAELDFSRPDAEVRNVPRLHAKYWQLYTHERQRYLALKHDHDKLRLAKIDYFTGRMSDEELKEREWPPQPLRIVRGEVEQYLAADADLSVLASKLDLQKTKLSFLEDVIKSIGQRNFLIKNYIDFLRWSQGAE